MGQHDFVEELERGRSHVTHRLHDELPHLLVDAVVEVGVGDVTTVVEDFLRVEREQEVERVLEDLVPSI